MFRYFFVLNYHNCCEHYYRKKWRCTDIKIASEKSHWHSTLTVRMRYSYIFSYLNVCIMFVNVFYILYFQTVSCLGPLLFTLYFDFMRFLGIVRCVCCFSCMLFYSICYPVSHSFLEWHHWMFGHHLTLPTRYPVVEKPYYFFQIVQTKIRGLL